MQTICKRLIPLQLLTRFDQMANKTDNQLCLSPSSTYVTSLSASKSLLFYRRESTATACSHRSWSLHGCHARVPQLPSLSLSRHPPLFAIFSWSSSWTVSRWMRQRGARYCNWLFFIQELGTGNAQRRDWRGIITALLVIFVICLLIFLCGYIFTPCESFCFFVFPLLK